MRKSMLLSAAILISGSLASRGQSIAESVRSALQRSPSVQIAIHQARASAHDITIARGARLPTVTVEGSAGSAYRDRSVDGISTGTGDALFSRRASVALQQLLFDFGASGRLVDAARYRTMFEELLVAAELEDQAGTVVSTYVDVMRYRLQTELLQRKVMFLAEYRNVAAGRKAKDGEAERIILDGRIATAIAEREKTLAKVKSLERRFQQLTLLTPTSLKLPEALPVGDAGYVDTTAHPRAKAAALAVNASRENAAALEKDMYPKVFLQLQAGVGEDVVGIRGPDNDMSAMAVVRWNPFEGGRKRAAVSKAMAEVDKQASIVNEVIQALDDEVGLSVEEMRGAGRRYTQLATSVTDLSDAAGKYREQLKKDTNMRVMTVVGVLTEENNAMRELVDAEFDRHKASYAVMSAAGGLVDYFGLSGVTPGKQPQESPAAGK